jgi:hypothetical protein
MIDSLLKGSPMELIHQVTAADHGKRAVDVLIARTCISRMMSKRIRLHGELLKNGRRGG